MPNKHYLFHELRDTLESRVKLCTVKEFPLTPPPFPPAATEHSKAVILM